MKHFGKLAGYKLYIQKPVELLLSNYKHLVMEIGKKYFRINLVRMVYDL